MFLLVVWAVMALFVLAIGAVLLISIDRAASLTDGPSVGPTYVRR